MDIEMWMKLLGKSQDDPAVKMALAAAGLKKIPKLRPNRTDIRPDLKGHGLWLIMTDEAYLKQLDDQDIGEGPLILSGVTAYLDESASNDLYKGELPYKVASDMTKADLRKKLGPPVKSDDELRVYVWSQGGLKVFAHCTKEGKLESFGVMLPRAE